MWHDIGMNAQAAPTEAPLADKAPQKRKSVFVVSPIGVPGSEVHRKASYALKYIFREALQDDEWDVHRADEGEGPDSIGQHVIRKLWEADLVIADLTGHNPNVFYELAIAHGWRKPVVHLIAKGETIPFDIVDQRTIFYDITDLASVEATVSLLRKYAEYAIANTAELITPLTSFEKFSHIREDGADGGAAVAEVLEEVVSRLSRLEHSVVRHEPLQDNREQRGRLSRQMMEEVRSLVVVIEQLTSKDDRTEAEDQLATLLKARASDVVKDLPSDLATQLLHAAASKSRKSA